MSAPAPKPCHAAVPDHGQSICTRDKGHTGEHRCKAADVDARAAGRSTESAPAPHTPGHVHEFAVDASCDCGVMLSALVRSQARTIAALLAALLDAEEWLCLAHGDPGDKRDEALTEYHRVVLRIRAALRTAREEE